MRPAGNERHRERASSRAGVHAGARDSPATNDSMAAVPLSLIALLLLPLPGTAAERGARAACTEPGKARWGAKSNIPRPSSLVHARRVALKDLMALEDPDPAPKRGAPTTGLIIGARANSLRVHEGQILRTRGYLRLVATEDNDCEYHIQLTLSPRSKASLIVEVAKDDAVSIHSTFVRARAREVRTWIRDELLGGHEPPEGARLITPPAYVEVVGQLFFDSAHGERDRRGKLGMPAANRWELHPVLAIKAVRAP